MQELIELLHTGHYSCVISYHHQITTYTQRGIVDLYQVYKQQPSILKGAFVADKVVGKGAAALMVLGGIDHLYADVISKTALDLLQKAHIIVTADKIVPSILNRNKSGQCPLELRCREAQNAESALPLIEQFVSELKQRQRETAG